MARAEEAAVAGMVKLNELCDHDLCSCKKLLGEKVPDMLKIEKPTISEKGAITPLRLLFEDGGEHLQGVSRVVRREEVVEAFNNCDGPYVTTEGILCGAIDLLRRKRTNG